MSSLLSTVTRTTDETASNRDTEQQHETAGSEDGGSRLRILGLAAAGLGAAYLLRRRRASERPSESQDDTKATTGELNATDSASGKQGRSVRGRLAMTVAGITASVVTRRAIRRWREQ